MNKIRGTFAFYLILIFTIFSNAQVSSDEEPATKSPLFHKIIYTNDHKKPKVLTKIGVKVDKFNGGFCPGMGSPSIHFTDILQLQADYVLRFDLYDHEIIIDANPPLEILPSKSVYFTISYFPIWISGCAEGWSAHISPILIFNKEKPIYGTPKLISESDVGKFLGRTPEEFEIIEAFNHRSFELQRQALTQLPKSSFDTDTKKSFIRRGLNNVNPEVRMEAAKTALELRFNEFAKKIAFLLSASKNEEEIKTYCNILGEFKDPDTIETLVSVLSNITLKDAYSKEALIKLNHPDVIKKTRPLLVANKHWVGKNNLLNLRYIAICEIIIAYRDIESIKVLLSLINIPKYSKISFSLVSAINNLTEANQIIKDPFVIGMRPLLEERFKNGDSDTRRESLLVLYQMPIADVAIQNFLRAGFKDRDVNIRFLSADLAADLGYKSLANEIILLLKSSKSEYEQEMYCRALQKLKVSCK